ncbi:Quaternary ammonium compound-resistance protein QacC [Anoxybacillus sp. P3H1B]|uniref:DMT family transporter n=1 Tax=Anoxybacillaceae TaxID=3120669 RepID=UPI000797CB87|nr:MULTISPECIES: multidrug efflux SMR transporter [Anoxybacillus]KXG08343.1 Quaternary ammonium compound-resistance protein QacC [Anoxybacillus sp. P3H1B]MBB3908548.1 small multidrug resistance pump [Anoxybacillus rupiensis]
MSWFFLLLGIISEVMGTTSMKMSQGFAKLIPSIFMFVFYGTSLTFVTLALKKIDVSIAYAIWSGLGTAIIAAIGILFFKESFSLFKLLAILLIIIGVVMLNMSGEAHGTEAASSYAPMKKNGEQ